MPIISRLPRIVFCIALWGVLSCKSALADCINWPLMNDVSDIRLSNDGRYIACRGGTGISENVVRVFKMDANNQPQNLVWTSKTRFPNSIIRDYAWWGDKLFLSKIDSPRPLDQLEDEATDAYDPYERLSHAKGNTVVANINNGHVSGLFSIGYDLILPNLVKGLLAVAPPDSDGGNLEFYHVKDGTTGPNLRFVKIAQFHDSTLVPFGRRLSLTNEQQSPIIGWSQDGTGVFIASLAGTLQNGSASRTSLFFVNIAGKSRDCLPRNASVDTDASLSAVIGRNQHEVWAYATYSLQNWALIRVSSEGIRQRISLQSIYQVRGKIEDSVHAESNSTLTAFDADGRFVLQDSALQRDPNSQLKRALWIIDLQEKRRFHVADLPEVNRAWRFRDGFLVQFMVEQGNGYNRTTSVRYALLKVHSQRR